MPPKSNRKKKTPSPPARAAARRSTKPPAVTNASPALESCYVAVSPLTVTLTATKPKGSRANGPCADFAAARSAAIDALLSAIEQGERQLMACKRATDFDALRKVSAAR